MYLLKFKKKIAGVLAALLLVNSIPDYYIVMGQENVALEEVDEENAEIVEEEGEVSEEGEKSGEGGIATDYEDGFFDDVKDEDIGMDEDTEVMGDEVDDDPIEDTLADDGDDAKENDSDTSEDTESNLENGESDDADTNTGKDNSEDEITDDNETGESSTDVKDELNQDDLEDEEVVEEKSTDEAESNETTTDGDATGGNTDDTVVESTGAEKSSTEANTVEEKTTEEITTEEISTEDFGEISPDNLGAHKPQNGQQSSDTPTEPTTPETTTASTYAIRIGTGRVTKNLQWVIHEAAKESEENNVIKVTGNSKIKNHLPVTIPSLSGYEFQSEWYYINDDTKEILGENVSLSDVAKECEVEVFPKMKLTFEVEGTTATDENNKVWYKDPVIDTSNYKESIRIIDEDSTEEYTSWQETGAVTDTFKLKLHDEDEYVSDSDTLTINVDNQGPSIGYEATTDYTKERTVKLLINDNNGVGLVENSISVVKVESEDRTSPVELETDKDGDYCFKITENNDFKISAEDKLGNSSTIDYAESKITNLAPTIKLVYDNKNYDEEYKEDSSPVVQKAGWSSYTGSVEVTVTARNYSGVSPEIEKVGYKFGDVQDYTPVTITNNNKMTFSISGIENGENKISVMAQDSTGNISEICLLVNKDTEPPTDFSCMFYSDEELSKPVAPLFDVEGMPVFTGEYIYMVVSAKDDLSGIAKIEAKLADENSSIVNMNVEPSDYPTTEGMFKWIYKIDKSQIKNEEWIFTAYDKLGNHRVIPNVDGRYIFDNNGPTVSFEYDNIVTETGDSVYSNEKVTVKITIEDDLSKIASSNSCKDMLIDYSITLNGKEVASNELKKEVVDDTVTDDTDIVIQDGNTFIIPVSNVGEYVIEVTATDAVGKGIETDDGIKESVHSKKIVIDKENPIINIGKYLNDWTCNELTMPGTVSDKYVGDTVYFIYDKNEVAPTDIPSTPESIEVYLQSHDEAGKTSVTTKNDDNTNGEYKIVKSKSDFDGYCHAWTYDKAGNVSNVVTYTVKIDTEAPELTIDRGAPENWTNKTVVIKGNVTNNAKKVDSGLIGAVYYSFSNKKQFLVPSLEDVTDIAESTKLENGLFTISCYEEYQGYCHIWTYDNAGNPSNVESEYIQIDLQSPVINNTSSGLVWTNDSVEMTGTVSDKNDEHADSGLVENVYYTYSTATTFTPPLNVSAASEYASTTITNSSFKITRAADEDYDGYCYVWTYDRAGNVTKSTRYQIQIDIKPPVVNATASANGWTKEKVEITGTVVDGSDANSDSGALEKVYYKYSDDDVIIIPNSASEADNQNIATEVVTDGAFTITRNNDKDYDGYCHIWTYDTAGNPSSVKSFPIRIDIQEPVITSTASANDWTKEKVEIKGNVSDLNDAESDSGIIKKIYYTYSTTETFVAPENESSISETEYATENVSETDGSFTITRDNDKDYDGYCHAWTYDIAGNVSKVITYKIQIDIQKPVITSTASANDWTKEKVEIKGTVSDANDAESDSGITDKVYYVYSTSKSFDVPKNESEAIQKQYKTEDVDTNAGSFTITRDNDQDFDGYCYVWAYDEAGNVSDKVIHELKIDIQKPVIDNKSDDVGWTNQAVKMTGRILELDDDKSDSGLVGKVYYSYEKTDEFKVPKTESDAAGFENVICDESTGKFEITRDNADDYDGYCYVWTYDKAGNVSNATIYRIQIDIQKPIRVRWSNDVGWTNQPVKMTGAFSDKNDENSDSGLINQVYYTYSKNAKYSVPKTLSETLEEEYESAGCDVATGEFEIIRKAYMDYDGYCHVWTYDEAGNVSEVITYRLQIDIQGAKKIKQSQSPEGWTNQPVKMTGAFSDVNDENSDSGLTDKVYYIYSKNEEYVAPKTLSETLEEEYESVGCDVATGEFEITQNNKEDYDGYCHVWTYDAAGNLSDVITYRIQIDIQGAKKIKQSQTPTKGWTNQSVVMIGAFSDVNDENSDSGLTDKVYYTYSQNEKYVAPQTLSLTLEEYESVRCDVVNGEFEITKNNKEDYDGYCHVWTYDEAGNVSEVITYRLQIDIQGAKKIKQSQTPTEGWTNQSVVMTGAFSDANDKNSDSGLTDKVYYTYSQNEKYVAPQTLSQTLKEKFESEECDVATGKFEITKSNEEDYDGYCHVWTYDEAGNVSEVITYIVRIETKDPTVTIKSSVESDKVIAGSYKVTISAKDEGTVRSGISKIFYKVYADGVTTQEGTVTLDNSQDNFDASIDIEVDASKNEGKNIVIGASAIDNAGNQLEPEEKINSASIDITKPVITVSYDNNTSMNEYYFAENRVATLQIVERYFDENLVKMVTTGKFSGWSNNGDVHTATILFDTDGDYTFDISCKDKAGNESDSVNYSNSTAPTSFTIDKTLPEITVSYDNNTVLNERYFSNNRVATITIVEHNFNANAIDMQATGAVSGWTNNGDIHTATVTYDIDGDYLFDVNCKDMAGNASNPVNYGDSVMPTDFTIDKTAPILAVTYDNNAAENGNYYKAGRTATVRVTEHNFDAQVAGADILPTVNNWTSDGDEHWAVLSFTEDGIHTLDAMYTDLAGNPAVTVVNDQFVIDTVAPLITSADIINKFAYNSELVEPKVNVADINYDADRVEIKLVGGKVGDVTADYLTRTVTEQAGYYRFSNILVDDLYNLEVTAYDKAGNVTTTILGQNAASSVEESVELENIAFSVNRNGSVYTIDSQTKDVLDKAYVQKAGNIVFYETNVDILNSIKITLAKDNQSKAITEMNDLDEITLKEGEGFRIEREVIDGGWSQYKYIISEDNFKDDGIYRLSVYSLDRAGNISENTMESKLEEINFIVDSTKPICIVSDLTSGEIYNAESKTVVFQPSDNLLLDTVTVYLNGTEIAKYEEAEYLTDFSFAIPESDQRQVVSIVCYDAAGNMDTFDYDDVYVTTSRWIRFINNRKLVAGAIGGGAGALAVIIFLILLASKKKKQENV